MPLRAPPTGAERDAEPDVPYSAGAPLRSTRDLFASAGLRLIERVGVGGSSEVWRALDPRERSIALKIPLSGAPDALARLEREHDVLAAAQHGHIVETHGLIEHDGACALALEYLPGGDLVSLAGRRPAPLVAGGIRGLRCAHASALARLCPPRREGAQRAVRCARTRAPHRLRVRLAARCSGARRRHHGRTPAVRTQPDCHGRGRRLCVRGPGVRAYCGPATVRSRRPLGWAARVARAPHASGGAQGPRGAAGRASPRRARSRP